MSIDRGSRPLVLALLVGLSAPVAVCADDDPAVQRGLQFLRGHSQNEQVGEMALAALAMIKAEVPKNDPGLLALIAKIRARFASSRYTPQRTGGHDIYEAACVAMALSNLEAEERRFELGAVAHYIVSKQKANGSWDYDNRTAGDTSISQYAILGLWEAENGGVEVPPQVWDRAAAWLLSIQAPGGSWNYHRDESAQYPETISMTAAGAGTLLICQRQLARHRRGGDGVNSLLEPIGGEAVPTRYTASTPAARIDQGVRGGLAWLGSNFTTDSSVRIGQSIYYALYGIERIGALADREMLGKMNWFENGRQFIVSSQKADGSWSSTHGTLPNTCWAVLFVTKSTAKTIRRVEIKRLGAGTLLGGRGLPKDLSNLTVAGGRVISRPMNGAVVGMLSVLEDPRTDQAEAALSGLITRYQTEGPGVLRPHKDRFRKLLTDRDPGLRRVAVWGLARMAELDVVPLLIDILTDQDESVVTTAREGLQLLSRKIEGLGPPTPSTPEQRQDAARRWRAWYAGIRPLDLEGEDDQEKSAPPRSPRS
jgi:hypothetical protein